MGPSAHYVHKLLDYLFEGKKDMNTAVKKVSLSPGFLLASASFGTPYALQGMGSCLPRFRASMHLQSALCCALIGVLQVALEQASYGPFCNVMAISYISAIVEGKDDVWPL